MTTETDVKQRLGALRATLAGATMACPNPRQFDYPSEDYPHQFCIEGGHEPCKGTGEVARFPEMRQVCDQCQGKGKRQIKWYYKPWTWETCKTCKGLGWQVRAGGMEDALAGLGKAQRTKVLVGLAGAWEEDAVGSDAILAETLELACEVTGLEVPPACAS